MFHCILGATNQNSFMAPIMHCCMNKYDFMFRGDLFVTIAEIRMFILDVCVCIYKLFLGYFFF